MDHKLAAIVSISPKILDRGKKYKWYGVTILIICAYFLFTSATTQTVAPISPQDIYRVKTGDVVNAIKVLGNTKITNQQVLTFGQEGTVKGLYVKQGQWVKKGDLLAELDKKSLSNDIAQQAISMQNARINYQKLLNQYTPADKIKAQQSYDDAKAKLEKAQKELQDMLIDQGDTLQTQSTSVQSIFLAIKNTLSEEKTILENIDVIFGITERNKHVNENIELYLSARNTLYKDNTERSYLTAVRKISETQTTLSSLEAKKTVSLTEIQSLQNKNKDTLNTLSTTISNAKNGVDNSIVSVELPQSKIDSRVSSLISANSKILSLLSSANNDTKTLQSTQNDIKNKKNEIKNYEAQVAIAQEGVQDATNGPKSEDKQLQANSIKQMQISISKLSDQADNYELRAPFDGAIDVAELQKGDNITMDNISSKSITISNPDVYQVEMLIDQVDIVKIDKGQSVEVTFDAYPGYMVTGAISIIDPTPVTNAGVISYTAKIDLQKGGKKIYDGMTVNVKIITEKKEGVLLIPTTAIQTENEKPLVQVMERGGLVAKKSIVVGINDGSNTEILSGIVLGDRVLLKEYKQTTTTTTKASATSAKNSGNARESTRGLGVGGSSAQGGMGKPDF